MCNCLYLSKTHCFCDLESLHEFHESFHNHGFRVPITQKDILNVRGTLGDKSSLPPPSFLFLLPQVASRKTSSVVRSSSLGVLTICSLLTISQHMVGLHRKAYLRGTAMFEAVTTLVGVPRCSTVSVPKRYYIDTTRDRSGDRTEPPYSSEPRTVEPVSQAALRLN